MSDFARMSAVLALAFVCGAPGAVVVSENTTPNSSFRFPELLDLMQQPAQALAIASNVLTDTALHARDCEFAPVFTTIPCVETTDAAAVTPASDIAQVSVSGTVTAGGDIANSDVNYVGSGSLAVPFRTLDGLSGDFQRLTVSSSQAGPVDVDITFSVSTSVVYAAGAAIPNQFPEASAFVEILDPVGVQVNSPTAAVWQATAFAAPAVQLSDALINETRTVTLEANKEYFVVLGSQSALTVTMGTDYSGLDVDATGFADPVFEVNAAFAAANPGVTFDVQRVTSTGGAPSAPGPMAAAVPMPVYGLAVFAVLLCWRALGARRRQPRG
ncbi:MAG: hypothetical protein KJO38_09435 [Gammaproteobacteria bacterium]|nr:hypothetical protein [Gammaproteobacteria bacterium]